jgi:hypothetical protein
MVITGPPGSGKTRLMAEFIARAGEVTGDDGHLVLRVACTSAAGAPHGPWLPVLQACSRQPVAETTPHDDPFGFYQAVLTRIRSRAERQPVVVVVDDAHRADLGSLRLLDLLSRSSVDIAALVLVAHRDHDVSLGPEASGLLAAIARHGGRMPLAGLTFEDTTALLAGSMHGAPDVDLVRQVHVLTGGCPLLVNEAACLLPTVRAAGSERLPDIGALASRALDTLSGDERDVLEAAAVIGTEFDEATLAVVCRQRTHVGEVLTAIARRGFVRRLDPRGWWRFTGPLVRDAVLALVDAGRAVELRRRFDAAAHRAAGPGDVLSPQNPSRVARGAAAARSGHAVDLCRYVAQIALDRGAHREAVSWLDNAVELADRDPATDVTDRLDLLLLLARAHTRAGSARSALLTFRRAWRLADRAGDTDAVARAVVAAVHACRRDPEWHQSIEDVGPLIDRTLEQLTARQGGDPALRARLLAARSIVGTLSFDFGAAVEAADAASTAADESTDVEARNTALVAARWAAQGSRSLRADMALTDQLLLHAEQAGDAEGEWLALRWSLHDGLEAADPDLVNRAMTRSIALAERLGQPGLLFHSHAQAATVALVEGRLGEVQRLHRAGKAHLPPDEIRDELTLGQELHVSWERGAVDPAIVAASAEVLPAPLGAAIRCWARTTGDDLAAARSDLDRYFADGRLEDVPDGTACAPKLCLLADAVARTGLERHADRVRERLLRFTDRCAVDGVSAGVWLGPNHLYLGMLSVVLGDHEAAEQHLSASQRVHRRMGARCHLVRADLWRARLAIRRRERSAARGLLASVVSRAEVLGMAGVVADARSDLRTLDSAGAATRGPLRWGLRRDGAAWRLTTGAATARLRDRRGLHYLHTLLGQPGSELHVLDLVGAGPDYGVGPALDARAKAEYGRRVEDLRDQIDEGERWGDPARIERARDELDAIAQALAGAMGLGGRDRPSDAGERARVSVRKAVRSAIDAIAEHAPDVAAHLDATVRTGYYCAYVADPAAPVTWET